MQETGAQRKKCLPCFWKPQDAVKNRFPASAKQCFLGAGEWDLGKSLTHRHMSACWKVPTNGSRAHWPLTAYTQTFSCYLCDCWVNGSVRGVVPQRAGPTELIYDPPWVLQKLQNKKYGQGQMRTVDAELLIKPRPLAPK